MKATLFVSQRSAWGNSGNHDQIAIEMTRFAVSVTALLLREGVLGNVTPILSTVRDNRDGEHYVEKGARVDLFDITAGNVLHVWHSMRSALAIHCVWIDAVFENDEEYHGCICKAPFYNGPLTCSEY